MVTSFEQLLAIRRRSLTTQHKYGEYEIVHFLTHENEKTTQDASMRIALKRLENHILVSGLRFFSFLIALPAKL
jgi:hypothetical protein